MDVTGMGAYEIIMYNCIHCGAEASAQTKLLECEMRTIKTGEKFEFKDSIILLKEACEHCGKYNAIKILNNKFNSVVSPEQATISELPFGDYETLDKKI